MSSSHQKPVPSSSNQAASSPLPGNQSANNFPFGTSKRTFYNDQGTGTNHPQPARKTSPTIPFPNMDSPSPLLRSRTHSEQTNTDHEERIHVLERRISGMERVMNAQSAKLTLALEQIAQLCAHANITIPEPKDVEKRMEDYAEKFAGAKENADEAVRERKRTMSNKIREALGLGVIVGEDEGRKRFLRNMERSLAEVNIVVDVNVMIDSIRVVDHKLKLEATACKQFDVLFKVILTELEMAWKKVKDAETVGGTILGINTETGQVDKKWVMKLEEDTHAAVDNQSRTMITKDDYENGKCVLLMSWGNWYKRNVEMGKKGELLIEFVVHLQSGKYKAPEY
jgi:hypothetical protein